MPYAGIVFDGMSKHYVDCHFHRTPTLVHGWQRISQKFHGADAGRSWGCRPRTLEKILLTEKSPAKGIKVPSIEFHLFMRWGLRLRFKRTSKMKIKLKSKMKAR